MLGQRSYRKIFGSHPSLDPDLGILKNYFYYGEIAEISNRNCRQLLTIMSSGTRCLTSNKLFYFAADPDPEFLPLRDTGNC